jgi:hypothetical protein
LRFRLQAAATGSVWRESRSPSPVEREHFEVPLGLLPFAPKQRRGRWSLSPPRLVLSRKAADLTAVVALDRLDAVRADPPRDAGACLASRVHAAVSTWPRRVARTRRSRAEVMRVDCGGRQAFGAPSQ